LGTPQTGRQPFESCRSVRLGWVTNKRRTPEQLHRIFYAMRFLRRLNRLGYVHLRRWKLYGEEALASLR
jgi:hypothetical protein